MTLVPGSGLLKRIETSERYSPLPPEFGGGAEDLQQLLAGFAIERRMCPHEMRHVGNMHAESPVAVVQPLQRNGVVEIAGIDRIDGEKFETAQIHAALQTGRRQLLDFRQHALGKLVGDAVGVHGVILQERRGVDITPAVVSASSGAVEHLHVAVVTNLVTAMRRLKEEGIWLVGLDMGPDTQTLDKVDLNVPLAMVMGSEGEGLRRLVRETCDLRIMLPMRGHVSSLNVATAGSIALYSAWQGRGWTGWQPSQA